MLDTIETPNERAVIGGNIPPVRAEMADTIAAIQSAAAFLIAAHPSFSSDATLQAAAEIKKRADAAAKSADAERKREKAPHDEAGKEVQSYWLPLIARADTASKELAAKSLAELSRRKAEKDEAERRARAEAARLAAEAEAASARAFEALDRASTGEVSDENHLEAKQAAIDSHEAAKKAAADAAKIGKASVGIQVAGAATVTVRTTRRVRLAFPKDGTRAQRATALMDFMECIAKTPGGSDLTETMVRLANRVYREMKVVPPHCEEYDEEKVS